MVYIAKEMNIPVDQKLTLVAIPVLSGAILRVPGHSRRHYRIQAHRRARPIVLVRRQRLCLAFRPGVPTEVALFGALLGLGGASFAVALPQASRWYPPQLQGMVMGIAGAGNMGVVLDTLFAPSIAEAFRLAGRFRRAADPMIADLRLLRSRREGRARFITRAPAVSLWRAAARPRQPLVHVLLLHHLWRLRRPGHVSAALFHEPVHVTPVAAGLMVSRSCSSARPSVRWAARSPTGSAASSPCR